MYPILRKEAKAALDTACASLKCTIDYLIPTSLHLNITTSL